MPTFLNESPVFGPVFSRRFGVSLGVNLMPGDGKICTFDCLYCENGLNAERRTHTPRPTRGEIVAAVRERLERLARRDIELDVIDIAGNGEPTAHPDFAGIVSAVLLLRDAYMPKARVGVLSNGTLAHVPAVREALMRVDNNTLKLDTADQGYIELLDRPQGHYDVREVIETYESFEGHVTVQTIFLTGSYRGRSLDDTGERYVGPWLEALERIRPQAVTIYTVARDTPVAGPAKAAPAVLDGIAARVRELGIPCTVGY